MQGAARESCGDTVPQVDGFGTGRRQGQREEDIVGPFEDEFGIGAGHDPAVATRPTGARRGPRSYNYTLNCNVIPSRRDP